MPEYDFAATMREEVEQLRREIGAPDLRPALSEMAQRFQVSEEEALAALWRASKRHGETLSRLCRASCGRSSSGKRRSAGGDAAPSGAAGAPASASAASGAGA